MKAIRWLLLAAVVGATALSNMLAFAWRPTLPGSYQATKKSEAQYVYQELQAAKTDADKKALYQKYYWALLEGGYPKEAGTTALQFGLGAKPSEKPYNPEFADRLIKLSTAHIADKDFKSAEEELQQLLHYDQYQLDKTDARIARDYNNLAMLHLMIGTTSEKPDERQSQFTQSREFFDRADQVLGNATASQKISVLQNRSLLAEANHDIKQADSLKQQAEQVRKQLNVCVPVVQH